MNYIYGNQTEAQV